MTRWAMVADLRRCVGCQTCTAACKHVNATAPAVQWRRVLDIESGTFPEVGRTFVPVGCMHCADPPCMHVCPSTATGQREDGIVTIDYDICIGCAYCAVACPYQARYKLDRPRLAYGREGRMLSEARREDPARLGVAQKCTFCSDRIDQGRSEGLVPGVDPAATPACVNACIADTLHFGDLDDPASNVSRLLAENRSFSMHAELATGPGFHYVWAAGKVGEERSAAANPTLVPSRGVGDVGGAAPWLQQHWDWRAAGNFICGGTGSGLLLFAPLAYPLGIAYPLLALLALAFIAAGLFLVMLECGRPFRAPLNVLFHPQTSWMTREAMVAVLLFPLGLGAALADWPPLAVLASAAGAAFLYCQGRILKESKGIPVWREARIVLLIIATGLVEGGAVLLLAGAILAAAAQVEGGLAIPALVLLLLVVGRGVVWTAYRAALAAAAPDKALAVLGRFGGPYLGLAHLLPGLILLAAALLPAAQPALLIIAAILALLGGWLMKFVIVTRASYNQGFALVHTPERGAPHPAPGVKPGWSVSP